MFRPYLRTSALLGALTLSAVSAHAATELKVVGSWSNLELDRKFEQPFWTETLPTASGGELTTSMTTFDQMGIASGDVFRYLADGLFDVGMTVGDYVVGDAPELEGLDLPLLAPDEASARKIAEAYEPLAEQTLDKRFNSHLLAIVPYPAQVVFCNTPIESLADLSGKKVRASGRSTGEFINAIGAQSVNLAFNEVPGAMERGVIDCAVTGSLSGYSAGWQDVSLHLLPVPVGGWDYVITAVNNDRWNALSAAQQALIQAQLDEHFTAPVWANAADDTQQGIACLTGQGECSKGKPADMTLVAASDDDLALARKALEDKVLPAWAQRVDDTTINAWNDSVGRITGLHAAKP